MPKGAVKKNPVAEADVAAEQARMAVGEFKAKCLGVMAEVARTGKPRLITKRGQPFVEIARPRTVKNKKKESFIGRLEGKYTINGDLLEPVFPLEDYDMLK